MDETSREELAFRYVHGLLQPEEKKMVFELVLKDPGFAMLLREELELVRSMQVYRSELGDRKKKELLQRIKQTQSMNSDQQAIVATALKSVLKMTMPTLAYRTLIRYKGDVLA